MLIELKFRNFLSFKEETSFLMTQVKSFKELVNTNVIKTDRDFNLLKVATVYGANAGGKSNFIMAFGVICNIIYNSFSDSLKKDGERRERNFQFKLDTVSEKSNSMFEVSFLQEKYIYRYGFEILGQHIKKEWLYRKLDREIPLFIREEQQFDINKESFSEGEKYKNEVNENVLFLSHLAQYNQPVSKGVLKWFDGASAINGIWETFYESHTAGLLKEDVNFKNWVSAVLKYLEIVNVEAGEKDGEIFTYHNRYDENLLLVDAVRFPFARESDGTMKLIHFLGPIYLTLREGGVLFIDEFDCKLHPNLSKKLLNLFQEFNKRNAQFVFSAQDTSLLDKTLLRRDQIWFAEKDQFGKSSLYSLAEFNSSAVRNTSAFDKKYLDNTFGAADTLEITDKITNLLYAE